MVKPGNTLSKYACRLAELSGDNNPAEEDDDEEDEAGKADSDDKDGEG